MSPPSSKIIDWLNRKGFNSVEEAKEYVQRHGGASAAMDASLDFVFGSGKQEEELPTPISTGKTPLEQIREGETRPEEIQESPYAQPYEGALPENVKESISAPPSPDIRKKSLFRRFLDWLS